MYIQMVTIVDPHIKRDSGYHVHSEAEGKNYYVKKADGSSVYEGWCWPGSSSWVDFLDPAIREWWAGMFSLEKYQVKHDLPLGSVKLSFIRRCPLLGGH